MDNDASAPPTTKEDEDKDGGVSRAKTLEILQRIELFTGSPEEFEKNQPPVLLEDDAIFARTAAEQREKLEALTTSGGKVTVAQARSAAKGPPGNGGIKAPTKRIMRRVVEVSKTEGHDLSDDFLRGVRWAAGDLDSKSIKGLSAIMEEAAKRPRKQAE